MYKLNGHSLQRGVWFEPETQPMTLIERNSSSSITLGPDAPEIGFNDWLLDDEWPEGPIIWRVKSLDDQTDTETRTIGLEHVIRLLEDTKLFEDVETSDIAGGETCTARQAIEYLLARQSDWVLGDCGNDVSLPYEFSGGDSLLDAIESVSETLEDAEWWYDLSVYPFVLHIRRRSSTVMSEMRGGRNLSTLRRSISRSGMYTRIWPVGQNDLHISGDYLSRNESTYGRIDKIETNQGKTSEASLRAWGDAMLRHHCEPLVTITISGLELSQETGETLDWIQLNRVCRCPLPEFHTTILERVIKKQWRDRRKDPESVTVTLGNNAADVRDLTKTVEETSKSSGRGARGQAKQNYLFEANGEHLLYEIFDECGHLHGLLRMTEQSLRVAFENLNNSTRSEFQMTSESLRVQFENEINSTRSEFQMTSESLRVAFESADASIRSQLQITSESLRTTFENELDSTRSEFQITSESLRVQFENEINSTRSELEMTSESLRLSFESADASIRSQLQITSESLRVSFQNDIDSVRSEVTQTDRSWKAAVSGVAGSDGKVTAASIGVAINKDGSEAFINADHIHLTGDTLLSGQLTVENGALTVKNSAVFKSSVTFQGDNVQAKSLAANSIRLIGSASGEYYDITGTKWAGMIADAEVDGNILTLTKVNGDEITFSKATTLTGAWSGGTFTVTASPQNKTYSITPGLQFNGNGQDSFSAEMYSSESSGNVVRKTIYGYLRASGSGTGLKINACKQASGTGVFGSFNAGALFEDVTRYKGNGTRLASVTRYKGNGTQLAYYGTLYKGNGTRLGASGSYYKGNGTRLASVTRYKGNGTQLAYYGTLYKDNGARLGARGSYYKGNGTRLESVTRYKGNGTRLSYYGTLYKGDGSSVTGRGTAVSRKYYGTMYVYEGSATPVSKGRGSWFFIDDDVDTVYKGNGSKVTGRGDSVTGCYYGDTSGSYHLRGDSETVYASSSTGSHYLRGDSVTAYPTDSDGRNYLCGDAVTGCYYGDASGSYYLRGDSETVYASSSTGSHYLRGDAVTAYPTDSAGSNYLRGDAVAGCYYGSTSGSYYLRGDTDSVYAADNTGGYYLRGDADNVLKVKA